MLPEKFTIQDDFPPVSYEQWRALAEADLHGGAFEQKLVTHTYEGIDIQPLYTRRDQLAAEDSGGFPGLPPFVRGARPWGAADSGWDLRQEYHDPDIATANRAICEDVHGGVTSLLLRFDRAGRSGLDADDPLADQRSARDGLTIYDVQDLDEVLRDVELKRVPVMLDAGGAYLPASALLMALWRRRQVTPEQARGAFNADPLGVLARDGQLSNSPETSLQRLAELASYTSSTFAGVTAVGIDTTPYHEAGATAAQDIAFGIATGVAYLRVLLDARMTIDQAAQQMLFNFCVGTHHFLAIAKLRAARQVWWRVIQASGGSAAGGAMRLHVRTSRRVLTQRDPYVNLLRNTVGMFAAGIGGAESMTSVPFNTMAREPDEFSRRVARNTLLILQEEAHLNRIVDPAGGSWFLDRLTEDLAGQAWTIFQEVERQGGLQQALVSGWVADQIDSAFAPRAKDIARRKEGITGVSEFPDVGEPRLATPTADPDTLRAKAQQRLKSRPVVAVSAIPATATAAARMTALVHAAEQGASIGRLAQALGDRYASCENPPLELRSFAEPFEVLRDASDVWLAARGHRPRVFLVRLGPVSHYTARATYAKNFFEAGGFETLGDDGYSDVAAAVAAFAASGSKIAVICSSDKLYPEMVPLAAGQLKSAGARCVIVAGHPGANEAAWRTAGVDRFIFIKCDVLAILRELLHEEGVLSAEAI